MTKEELRAKYARVPTDFSEIEMLKDQLLDSGLLEVAQKDPENAGKAVVVGEDGALMLGDGGGSGGGAQLYKHYLNFTQESTDTKLCVLSTDSNAFSPVSSAGDLQSLLTTKAIITAKGSNFNTLIIANATQGPTRLSLYYYGMSGGSMNFTSLAITNFEFTDTVTPL